MNIIGIDIFPRNRTITPEEEFNKIDQKAKIDVEPHYQLSIIKMNSNYLESVDRQFGERGYQSAAALLVFFLLLAGGIALSYQALLIAGNPGQESDNGFWIFFAGFGIVAFVVILFIGWLSSGELFNVVGPEQLAEPGVCWA